MNILLDTGATTFRAELIVASPVNVTLAIFSEKDPGVLQVHDADGTLLAEAELARVAEPSLYWAWVEYWLTIRALRVDLVAHAVHNAPEGFKMARKSVLLNQQAFDILERELDMDLAFQNKEHVFFANGKMAASEVFAQLQPPQSCRSAHVKCHSCHKA